MWEGLTQNPAKALCGAPCDTSRSWLNKAPSPPLKKVRGAVSSHNRPRPEKSCLYNIVKLDIIWISYKLMLRECNTGMDESFHFTHPPKSNFTNEHFNNSCTGTSTHSIAHASACTVPRTHRLRARQKAHKKLTTKLNENTLMSHNCSPYPLSRAL